MAEIINMPKLSDTMEVGTIASWRKNEGDEVMVGDILCDVETDKATMDLENLVTDGVILKIYAEAGAEAPIGAPICAIGEKGEEPPEAPKPEEPKEPAKAFDDEPHEPEDDKELPEEHEHAEGRKQESKAPPPPKAGGKDGRIKASPLARKLAEQKGIPLEAIPGTGPQGRIVKQDVLDAEEKGVTATAEAESAPSAPAPAAPAPGLEAKEVKVSQMRKVIAKRLLESKTQVPHFYLETEVDAAALIKMRAELNETLAEIPPEQGGGKFTVNDFILKASAEALRRVPQVNAAWQGDSIQQYGNVHLAFGVALDDGLVTPVIRNAETKTLRAISREAKELIKKARDKKLGGDEMSGSTFTVTNLGMYGITGFYGIINMPNAAILSVGATIKKPVVNDAGEIVVGHRMALGMAGDHRIIDGAVGAEFLMALKETLEQPALMLV